MLHDVVDDHNKDKHALAAAIHNNDPQVKLALQYKINRYNLWLLLINKVTPHGHVNTLESGMQRAAQAKLSVHSMPTSTTKVHYVCVCTM